MKRLLYDILTRSTLRLRPLSFSSESSVIAVSLSTFWTSGQIFFSPRAARTQRTKERHRLASVRRAEVREPFYAQELQEGGLSIPSPAAGAACDKQAYNPQLVLGARSRPGDGPIGVCTCREVTTGFVWSFDLFVPSVLPTFISDCGRFARHCETTRADGEVFTMLLRPRSSSLLSECSVLMQLT